MDARFYLWDTCMHSWTLSSAYPVEKKLHDLSRRGEFGVGGPWSDRLCNTLVDKNHEEPGLHQWAYFSIYGIGGALLREIHSSTSLRASKDLT